MPNQTYIIRFDGRYFSYLDLDGNLVVIPAISGDTKFQNSLYQDKVDYGPIPEGSYDIKQSEYQSINVIDFIAGILNFGTWPKSIPAWGMEPQLSR